MRACELQLQVRHDSAPPCTIETLTDMRRCSCIVGQDRSAVQRAHRNESRPEMVTMMSDLAAQGCYFDGAMDSTATTTDPRLCAQVALLIESLKVVSRD